MNAAIGLIQKQCLIANAILVIPNYAIFIKTNLKQELKNFTNIDAREKNDAREDDRQMFLFFKGPKVQMGETILSVLRKRLFLSQ